MYFMAYIIAYLFWTILISLALHLSAQIVCVIEAQTTAKTLQIVIQSAAMLKVEHAQLPIWRLVPSRFEQGQATPEDMRVRRHYIFKFITQVWTP